MNNEKENFGIPLVDSSPMGIVGMEGQFFRGLSNNKTSRPLGLKFAIIIFSLVFFLLPGLFVLVMTFVAGYTSTNLGNEFFPLIVPALLGLLLFGAGYAGIKGNIRKS
jgi:hypothetical protein